MDDQGRKSIERKAEVERVGVSKGLGGDFFTVCSALVWGGIFLFVVVPFALFMLKASVAIAAPIAIVAIAVVLVAILGRVINSLRKHW